MSATSDSGTAKTIPFKLSGTQVEYAKLVEVAYPSVRVTRDVTFEEVWKLFLDSGFLYPDKVSRLQPVLPEIQQTVRSLLRENGNLLCTVVLRNETALDAQLSMLRWCESTWMVQHLAALPLTARTLDASAQLMLGFAYYARLRQEDMDWAKAYFRPNNAWPSRVFGGFAKRIDDPQTSDFRTYHYLVAPAHSASPAAPDGVEVRPAVADELPLVEDWYRSRGRNVEIAANQLDASSVRLTQLEDTYRLGGLKRSREILVAQRAGRIAGFALLEVSSIGMNFSELTNAFTVHLLEEDSGARVALIQAAKQRYAALGRVQCIGLEDGDDLSPFEACGFTKLKDYTCFTFHRQHMADMEEYFVTLFGARRRREA